MNHSKILIVNALNEFAFNTRPCKFDIQMHELWGPDIHSMNKTVLITNLIDHFFLILRI